jgi:exopolysaccharide production protein ExoQ
MNRSLQSLARDWPSPVVQARHWPFDRSLKELGLDGVCIAFLVTVTTTSARFPDLDRTAWLLGDLTVVVMLALWHGEFLDLARRNLILVSWPALATLSSLWSLNPGLSRYHGIQLFATVFVSFLLCIYARIDRLVPLIFTALLASAIISAAFVIINPGIAIAPDGEWRGLYPHKNLMGSMMSLLIIAATCLFLEGWHRWLTGGAALFAAMLLLASRSGTAIVALIVTLSVLPISQIIRKGVITVSMVAGLTITVGAAAALVIEAYGFDLMQAILLALGKDETLTGRTLLWDIAIDAYESRPWSGFGYKAWWSSQETAAPFVKYITGSEAGSFHNTLLEVAVAFGYAGPILLVLGQLFAFICALKAYARDSRPVLLWPLLTVVYIALTCTAESMLFANHGVFQLLLVVAAASAVRHIPQVQQQQRGQVVQGR